ncbi:hypothetical protein FB451DRAFT_1171370 [Mycena latifolia]|nr:hypothetical protein FB451DRAFT_1171370 [Mycena latifolia]
MPPVQSVHTDNPQRYPPAVTAIDAQSVIIQIPVPPALTLTPHSRGIVRQVYLSRFIYPALLILNVPQVYQYIDVPHLHQHSAVDHLRHEHFDFPNCDTQRTEAASHSSPYSGRSSSCFGADASGGTSAMLSSSSTPKRAQLRTPRRADSRPTPSPSPSASTTARDTSTAEKALLRRADLEQQVRQMQAEMAELQRIAGQVDAPPPAPELAGPPTTQQLDLLRARIGELESKREFMWMEDAPPGYRQLDGRGQCARRRLFSQGLVHWKGS